MNGTFLWRAFLRKANRDSRSRWATTDEVVERHASFPIPTGLQLSFGTFEDYRGFIENLG